MSDTDKQKLITAKTQAEVVRTILAAVQLIVSTATLVVVLMR